MAKHEPAFPIPAVVTKTGSIIAAEETGMTLRDYFAAQIMAGDAANSARDKSWEPGAAASGLEERAKLYYRMADAMIKARGHEK